MWLSEISTIMAKILVDHGLDDDNQEVYAYGIEVLLSNFLTILVSMMIAAFLGILFDVMLFWAAFVVVREVFHGYHSRNFYICFLLSLFCSIGVVMLSKKVENSIIMVIFLGVIYFLLIAIVNAKRQDKNVVIKSIITAISVGFLYGVSLYLPINSKVCVVLGVVVIVLFAYYKHENIKLKKRT